MSKPTKRNSGFTLIELLVVIIVISALSGVLLSVINSSGIRGKARDSQRKADLKRIQAALELYFADNREYPSTGDPVAWEQVSSSSFLVSALQPDYIDPVPLDPLDGDGTASDPSGNPNVHRYNYISGGSYYYLTAIMEVSTSKDDSPCSDNASIENTETADNCYYVRNP